MSMRGASAANDGRRGVRESTIAVEHRRDWNAGGLPFLRTKKGLSPDSVLSPFLIWRARRDSNSRPPGS